MGALLYFKYGVGGAFWLSKRSVGEKQDLGVMYRYVNQVPASECISDGSNEDFRGDCLKSDGKG